MKALKVKSLRAHIGVQLKGTVLSSIDSKKHGYEMECWPMGIRIQGHGMEVVVTYNNVQSFEIFPEEAAAPTSPKKDKT